MPSETPCGERRLARRRVRFCRSPNSRGGCAERVLSGQAAFWRCPRCGLGYCTTCEGAADGWSVCDRCWVWIRDQRWSKALFLRLISRWGYRGERRALRAEYLDDVYFNGLPARPAAA